MLLAGAVCSLLVGMYATPAEACRIGHFGEQPLNPLTSKWQIGPGDKVVRYLFPLTVTPIVSPGVSATAGSFDGFGNLWVIDTQIRAPNNNVWFRSAESVTWRPTINEWVPIGGHFTAIYWDTSSRPTVEASEQRNVLVRNASGVVQRRVGGGQNNSGTGWQQVAGDFYNAQKWAMPCFPYEEFPKKPR